MIRYVICNIFVKSNNLKWLATSNSFTIFVTNQAYSQLRFIVIQEIEQNFAYIFNCYKLIVIFLIQCPCQNDINITSLHSRLLEQQWMLPYKLMQHFETSIPIMQEISTK